MDAEKSEYTTLLAFKAARGDDAAFTELVRLTEKRVYNLARRYSQNEQDAADLSQLIYIKVWRSLSGFRGDSSFFTWLYRVAQNTAIDESRRRQRHMQTVSLTSEDEENGERGETEFADTEAEPSGIMEKKEKTRAIAAALARLSEEHRKILVLRDVDGYSYTEISGILSLDIGTVKSRINRAREKMRIYLKEGNIL